MARVTYIEEATTEDPAVRAAFERMVAKRGKVTNIYKALAHKPAILAVMGPFVAAVQQPDEIDAKLKERIILRVSMLNRSAYCTHAHEQISAKMGFTPAEIAEMRDPDDVYEELRRHFGESQIVEITMIAALYNMVNRFNEALKLDLEPY